MTADGNIAQSLGPPRCCRAGIRRRNTLRVSHCGPVSLADKTPTTAGAALEQTDIECLIGGRPRLAVEEIIKHPRLPQARKLFLDRFLEVYRDPDLARLLIESGRFLVFHLLVILKAAQDPARRDSWPTVGLLKEKMALFGLASGRHIDHLIDRLCEAGFLELRSAKADRRVRVLSPTKKMHAHDRDWLAAHYAPLTALCPEHNYGPVMRRDPHFQATHRRASVPFLPLGAKVLLGSPEMLLFLNRAAGYLVLATLLQAAMAAPDQLHVSYGDVASRCGVSRTHVRKLLVAAEEAGLVKLHARGGHRVEILPRLWAAHDRAIAGGMYLHDMVYLAAIRQLDRQPPPG
jgi:hypothetical protein